MEENQKKSLNQVSCTNPVVLDLVFQKTKGKGLKYQKINKEKTKILRTIFHENPYPNKIQYENLSQEFLIPTNKIINWFKFQRKEFLKIGKIKLYKKRRILSKDEEIILEENFRQNTNPTPIKFQELAKELKCKKRQVRNWFAYRRKKLNKISKFSKNGIKNIEHEKAKLRKKQNNNVQFQNIFNDENMEKSSSIHSNNDDILADKNSTESTSNQNTKKENSNDSGKNEKMKQKQQDHGFYPQQILNKSQFYLPNQDQHQNQLLMNNNNSGNDSNKMKNSMEFNNNSEIKNIGNNSNNNYQNQNYLNNNNFIGSNNNFLGSFQQNYNQSNQQQFLTASAPISYIPYKVIPYGQYLKPNNQPTIIGFPTLAYFPINTPTYYPNQMLAQPMYPQMYTNFNGINMNLGGTQNKEASNNLPTKMKNSENRDG